MQEGKVWGVTKLLLRTPLIEIHELAIKPNVFCSEHLHGARWNAFYVISGRLFIRSWKDDYGLVDETELGPGELFAARPGEWHQFLTRGDSALALEIYYPQCLSSADIKRRNSGGKGAPVDHGSQTVSPASV